MLTISAVSKAYAGRPLFADLSLQLDRGDRLGLVGPNGAGKSTLLSLILGLAAPDTGRVALQRGVTVGHLPQETAPAGDATVLDLATAISPEYTEARDRWRALESAADPDPADVALWHGRFEALGGDAPVPRALKILKGLAFRERDHARPLAELSGGWVMRAHLARLLVQEPDLLLLDEPTNHLDLEALLWFQAWLLNYPGALVLISHDRSFLNALATSILEIRQGRAARYRGDYDAYLRQREASDEQWMAAWKNQQREIARLQRFVDRFGAKNTKATQAQSKRKQIERLDVIEAPPGEEATVDFQFPQPPRSGHRVVSLDRVRFRYHEATPLYDALDFQAERGQRIVLVGPNGAGKSTLLNLLAGVITPQAGERRLGHHVKAGYYAQYRAETLHPDFTVLEEAFTTPQRLTETFVRTVLGAFLFRGDDVFKPVRVLSGGEKSRLALVKLLLDPPNLLLMDEPTTHLDLASVDALLYALTQFQGTLVFISHDLYFIRSLANHVVHVQNGRLTPFPGGYDYYEQKTATAGLAADAALEPPPPAAPSAPSPAQRRREERRRAAEERQERSRLRRAAEARVHALESAIADMERRQHELTTALQQPETYDDPPRAALLNQELKALTAQLAQHTADWESAAHALVAMDATPE